MLQIKLRLVYYSTRLSSDYFCRLTNISCFRGSLNFDPMWMKRHDMTVLY